MQKRILALFLLGVFLTGLERSSLFSINYVYGQAWQSAGEESIQGNQENETTEEIPQETQITEEARQEPSNTEESPQGPQNSNGAPVQIAAAHGVLMEASTGTIIYEKEKDTQVSPASITKIMTLILIFDALEEGKITMDEEVTTSAYAKSMGGSQVFLEEGEKQTVETLIKCIVIASGNDASVAMAEHISGSEEAFVQAMNQRAEKLGMENTHFEDCCGLTESKNHYSSAYDVAIMSRELVVRYPKILEYSSVWMDTIIHETRQGSSEFGLTNTNKLIRSYEGCVGLKTGSTSIAKYCVSTVAVRNGITLIGVVMTAPDYKVRFSDAAAMLDYGFCNCSLYVDEHPEPLEEIPVKKTIEGKVPCEFEEPFCYLDTNGKSLEGMEKEIHMKKSLTAPVKAGDTAGKAVYRLEGQDVGSVRILAAEDMEASGFMDYLQYLCRCYISL